MVVVVPGFMSYSSCLQNARFGVTRHCIVIPVIAVQQLQCESGVPLVRVKKCILQVEKEGRASQTCEGASVFAQNLVKNRDL